jgi:eukaryotic-like serine/threonine-protein kinase
MRLTPGTRLGTYEVVDGLGAGGMGEVYRARDTVLHREVALKLVHPDYCHHADSLTRLRREARTLAALNHPNIATLHGLAEFDGSCGLVMELVAGDTLADLLRRRRLKVDEAIRFAIQIAAALEAAHERDIVHRDLKPANIKITPDGVVKVLDFGLAKAPEEDGTTSTLITEPGSVLGTAPYMSPEQARGAPIDRRTDVWAFGCVLFEMLAGTLAFGGASRSDVVVSILEKEPDWTMLPAETPASIRRLLKRCVQKDLRRRFRDIGDARLELEDAVVSERSSDPPTVADVTPARRRESWLRSSALIAAGVVIGALAMLGWPRSPTASDGADEVRFSVMLPDDERIASTELGTLAMHPDGRSIVYVATRGVSTMLMLRTFDGAATKPLPGTSGAVSPFFSADGKWIAYFADGKLKKIPIAGGTPVTICDAPDGLGGSWSSSNTIVFASATGSSLQKVSADGGAPARATELDVSRGEFSHRWPEFLPDGDTVLFTVGTVGEWDEAEIAAQSLRTGKRTSVFKGGTSPRYIPPGQLAYAHDGAIWIATFDPQRLTISGTPSRALEAVSTSVDGAVQFSVSRSGAAVYHPSTAASGRRLVVVDSQSQTPLAAPPHSYVAPRVSPDGKKVVLGVSDDAEHVWSYDLNTGTLTQLTFEASNRWPIWSSDGKRVTFASNRNGAFNLFTVPASLEGPAERLTNSDAVQVAGSWSPDGALLALTEQHSTTGRDVWLLRRDGERIPFAVGPADESAPRFSPDGRRIAYVSNESGQSEVYVREVGSEGIGRKISTDNGSEPVWRRDGSAVYFRSYGKLLAASPAGGATRVVFDGAAEPGTFDAPGYDVMSGKDRFLMITSASAGTAPSELRMILNWSRAVISSSR